MRVSECCSAENEIIDFNRGVDYQDLGLCPACKEHCCWVDEEDETTHTEASKD